MARNPHYPNRRSLRLKGYDYRQEGSYFITICTYQRAHHFGKIKSGEMHLSETGMLAKAQWHALPGHYPHIALDAFILMPDHLHGILHIIAPPSAPSSQGALLSHGRDSSRPPALPLSKESRQSKESQQGEHSLKRPEQEAAEAEGHFNADAINRVREYIYQNPMQWQFKYNKPRR